MTSKVLLMPKPQQLLLLLAIAESAVVPRKTISSPKSDMSKANTQKQRLAETPEAVLTPKEKGLSPYWNASCKVISSGLLLPIGIDSPASAERSYSSWSNKTVEKSWFSAKLFTVPSENSPKTYSRYSTCFPAGCMDSGATVIKSRKIEIFPTRQQKSILRRWFGTSRYVYNASVSALAQKDTPTGFKKLVPIVFDSLPAWHKETPRQIKVGAVMDACQAVKAAKVKCKQTGEFQKVMFRSRKRKQTLYLRADSLKKNGFYVRLLGELKMSEPLPANPQGAGKVSERNTDAEVKDSQLVLENGRYFLCVPSVEQKKMRAPSGKIVALDPVFVSSSHPLQKRASVG